MQLEARSPSCFSNQYVLKLDGSPLGEFRGRWFSESTDIRMTGRQQLVLQKESWIGSHFTLRDHDGGVLAQADRAGWFTSEWDMSLSTGPARLLSAGFFNTGYFVTQNNQTIASVDRIGWCEGGWYVHTNDPLVITDLLLIGLIYHTILKRRRSNSSSTTI